MEKYIYFTNMNKTYSEICGLSSEYDTIILDLGDLYIDPPFLNYLLKIFRNVKSSDRELFFISKKGLKNEISKYFRVFNSYEEYSNMKLFTSYIIKIYLDNEYLRNLLRNLFVTNGFLIKERNEESFLNKEHESKDKDIYIINFEKYQEEKLNEILKIKEKNKNSKIILLVDKKTAYKALKTVQLGVDSIIEKPINTDNLLETVKKLAIQSQLISENIKLNKRIKELYKELETELAIANDIQKNLMPKEKIEFNGYKIEYLFCPSQKIGGDFCDIFKLNEDVLAIVFADISGHGIPAALLSTMLKAVIHSEFKNYFNISELMLTLNERIIKFFPSGKFASLFYILLDTKNNKISYCKGSQESALMLNNGKIEELETEGQVLGIFSNKNFPDLVKYEQKTKDFFDDTVILLYTDGITEAIKDGQMYGIKRLKENFLKEKQNIYELKKTLDEYILEDDLMLLTIWRDNEENL